MYIIMSPVLLSHSAVLYSIGLVDINALGSQICLRHVNFLHQLRMRFRHIIKSEDPPAKLE